MNYSFRCQFCMTGDGFKPAGLLDKSREPYVFDSPQEFVSHLKLKHLTIKATSDGKIYICCYGPSGTCLSRSLSDLASVNGTSLSPSSFLSQKEYEKHLVSSHLLPEIADMAKPQSTHANGRRSPVRWSVLQSAVNLPAVLNDPTHRQIDIFSRTWGEQFERAEVLPSPTLPVITEKDFEHYLSKLGFRGNWASSAASPSLSSSKPNVLLQAVRSTTPSRNFPTNTPIAWPEDANTNRPQSLDSIPLVFFEHGFTLAHPKTFSQVIPLHPRDTTATGGLLPNITSFLNGCDFTTEHSRSSQKQQEHDFYAQHDRLANYLDVVEVHLAEQVSKKSSIFFEAVCCHDVVREKLSEALNQVRLVRQKLHQVDSTMTWAAMRLHRVVRRKAHYRLILEKLKVIASLQAAQPTIQMLLHSNDFCTALELVASTQELLQSSEQVSSRTGATSSASVPLDPSIGSSQQITCLRHLSAQLIEISRFVRHMIEAEFEASLRQFLEPRPSGAGQYRRPDLVPCLLGLLHIKRHDFVSAFRAELLRQVKLVQHPRSSSGVDIDDDSAKPEVPLREHIAAMSSEEWIETIAQRCKELQELLIRAQEAMTIFFETMNQCVQSVSDSLAKKPTSPPAALQLTSPLLTSDEISQLKNQLRSAIVAACITAQNHIVNLASIRMKVTTTTTTSKKVSTNSANGLDEQPPMDKLSIEQFIKLADVLQQFQEFILRWTKHDIRPPTDTNEAVMDSHPNPSPASHDMHGDSADTAHPTNEAASPKHVHPNFSIPPLIRLLLNLTRNAVHRFHQDRLTKVDVMLNQERWQAVVVPNQIQQLVEQTFESRKGRKQASSTLRSINLSDSESVRSYMASPISLHGGVASSVVLGGDRFVVVGTVLLLLPVMVDYTTLAEQLPCKPWSVHEVTERLAELLNSFNSRTCQLVLGAEARRSADLPTISARHLALTSRSLQLISRCIPIIRSDLESLAADERTESKQLLTSVPGYFTKRHRQQGSLEHVENLFHEHIGQISDKLFSLLSNRIQDKLSCWDVRPPTPSLELKAICRAFTRMVESTTDIMPVDMLTPILLRAHNEFKTHLRHRLSELGVTADGGPRQSLVDFELTYYMSQFHRLTARLSKFSDDFVDVWPTS
ncbi:Vacuolar protein sorting-associated protein 54 [Clonorchis sinensis]|uniref:Vacuolar protein sorting-associated protein 54 n=1 Tax=Clonorchis sinensis TaxID=79923 RepID=A0A8T1LZK9_CLOSI|nr:Vacuolar protein sorting-associated protein 54 [Clonorchis sinensis]